MTYEFFDVGTSGFKIFTRVELIGMFVEEGANGTGKSETEVGVDIDLTNSASCGFAELFFGDTDGIGHFATVLVDHLDVFLRNGRRTVENYREARETFFAFMKNVEAERRRNEDAFFVSGALSGGEFISAVRSTDSDSEGVAAGFGNEFLDLFGTGIGADGMGYFVFDSGEGAEFCFDDDAVSVSVFNDFFGDLDIFGEGFRGSVDHNGGEAAVDAGFAGLEIGAVVEVENYRNFGTFGDSRFDEFNEIGMVGVSTGAFGYLKDDGGFFLAAGFGDTLDDLHVVYVESADGVTAVIGLFKHFF